MDAANRFTLGAEEFARLLGPKTAAVLDRPWARDRRRAQARSARARWRAALAARDTWSGIVVDWPVDDDGERLPIEMSGLPVFDRDRQFAGFRGFGICRDVERLAEIERRRAAPPAPPRRPPPRSRRKRRPSNAKVLPFPTAPALSPGEHTAFQELARELSERLKKPPPGPGVGRFRRRAAVHRARAAAPEPPRAARNGNAARDTSEGRPILDRLPVGILVYRLNNLIYANRAFLDWTGYGSLDALAEAGGLDSLFIETKDGGAPATRATAARR